MRKHTAFRDGATGRRFMVGRGVGVEMVFGGCGYGKG